jgi:hypothetical protein
MRGGVGRRASGESAAWAAAASSSAAGRLLFAARLSASLAPTRLLFDFRLLPPLLWLEAELSLSPPLLSPDPAAEPPPRRMRSRGGGSLATGAARGAMKRSLFAGGSCQREGRGASRTAPAPSTTLPAPAVGSRGGGGGRWVGTPRCPTATIRPYRLVRFGRPATTRTGGVLSQDYASTSRTAGRRERGRAAAACVREGWGARAPLRPTMKACPCQQMGMLTRPAAARTREMLRPRSNPISHPRRAAWVGRQTGAALEVGGGRGSDAVSRSMASGSAGGSPPPASVEGGCPDSCRRGRAGTALSRLD